MQLSLLQIPTDLPCYTHEDYKQWSGDWELIDGIPYSLMPTPKLRHQQFSRKFVRLVEDALENNHCKCEVFYETDWIVTEKTTVRPDVMVVCGEVELDDWLRSPPVLILEIASPSTESKDKGVKLRLYKSQGVKYYIIANPKKKQLTCYELVGENYQLKEDSVYQMSGDCKSIFNLKQLLG